VGKKSGENVAKATKRGKSRGLTRVLVGRAIRQAGDTMAEGLACYVGSADAPLDIAAALRPGRPPKVVKTLSPDKGSGAIAGLTKKAAASIFAELDSEAVRRVFAGLSWPTGAKRDRFAPTYCTMKQ
jgi:hypothetical protein